MTSPISAGDDYPIHQIAEPVRRVATSDRNFYDRYYFNFHGEPGGPVGTLGLGVYPNLGVIDAFLLVTHEEQHRVVRASRELGMDRMDLRVGPLRLEILEGLERIRIRCEPNDWGLEMDAIWNSTKPPLLEPRHVVRSRERVTTETTRFVQFGAYEGWLSVGGETFDLGERHYRGSRDRSWGVRPVGEPEPRSGRSSGRVSRRGWQVHWAPVEFEDYAIHYFVFEDADGNRSMEAAKRIWPKGDPRGVEDLGRPEHELDFLPGTTSLRAGTVRFPHAPGGEISFQFTVREVIHNVVGTGYAGEDGWRHGKYQGELVVDGVHYDFRTEEGRAMRRGLVDTVCDITRNDGSAGWGIFEYEVVRGS